LLWHILSNVLNSYHQNSCKPHSSETVMTDEHMLVHKSACNSFHQGSQ